MARTGGAKGDTGTPFVVRAIADERAFSGGRGTVAWLELFCKHFGRLPREIKAEPDFGELVRVMAAATYTPDMPTSDD